jgi:NADH:ubiquinone reductase (H+-translocating)
LDLAALDGEDGDAAVLVGPPVARYRDKGNLATIGRGRAVAEIKGVRLSGPVAWITWLLVHLWYLIGFENRLLVLTRWSFSLLTRGRGARLITGTADRSAPARVPAISAEDRRDQRAA